MKIHWRILIAFVCLLFGANGMRADTLQLVDGSFVTGEIIVPGTADGLNIRFPSGEYKKFPWTQFSQEALKELASNPRLAAYAEPLIEITEAERIRQTEVTINPVPRLERPRKSSVLGGLLRSSVGLTILLLIYAANIYAGYEISILRAYPAAMVCGISALAPFIGPIIFLCIPTRMESQAAEPMEEESTPESPAPSAQHGQGPAGAPPGAAGYAIAPSGQTPYPPPAQEAAKIPATQSFKRGNFTFNRRFIETKFPGFFGIARREADKDMVLIIKAARGSYEAHRITRIAANDMHVETRHGSATQEVPIPFSEIQELILKHKDA